MGGCGVEEELTTEPMLETIPQKIARLLDEYIAKYGPPPPLAESIMVEVNGEVVEVQLFSMRDIKEKE